MADPQLAAGLQAMIGKINTDTWPTIGQSGEKVLVRKFQHDNLVTRRDALKERLNLVEELLAKLGAGEDIDIDKLAVDGTVKDDKDADLSEKDKDPIKDKTVEPVAP